MARHAGKRHVLPPQGRRALKFALTAAILAVVMVGAGVAWNLLRPQSASRIPSSAPVAASGAREYQDALSALAAGETTRAAGLLQDAVAKGYAPAKKRLEQIRASRDETSSAPSADALTAKVADIATLLPTSLSGYRLTDPETSAASAIVSGDPSAAPALGMVSRIAVSVYDRSTPSGAATWLSGFGRAFAHDLENLNVSGVPARFGTDGAHLASVVFVRGRYGFEVVATAVRGNPASLKTIVTEAAAALPAALPSR